MPTPLTGAVMVQLGGPATGELQKWSGVRGVEYGVREASERDGGQLGVLKSEAESISLDTW